MGKIQGPTDPMKSQARLELLLSVLDGKDAASQIVYGYHQKTGEPHYGGGLSSFGWPSEMLRRAYPDLDRLDFDELSMDLQQVRLDDSAAHNMLKRIGELKREWSDEDVASHESNERLITDAERVLYSMEFEASVSRVAAADLELPQRARASAESAAGALKVGAALLRKFVTMARAKS